MPLVHLCGCTSEGNGVVRRGLQERTGNQKASLQAVDTERASGNFLLISSLLEVRGSS
jgi:hypothetical protein